MGIKFFCDACGKKLNIKEELAGKKGRCPKCDAVIKIPKESKVPSSDKKTANSAATPKKTKSSSAEKPGDADSEVDSPPPVPSVSTGVSAAEKEPSDTLTVTKQSKSKPQVEAAPTQPEPQPPEPDSQPEATPDIFAANPNGRWFVRPVSGGQFGPAEPDVMKTWLKEGRVGRDSLVWCEGWEEWQNANEVFAEELGTDSSSSEKLVEEPNSTEAQPANRLMHHKVARKKAKTMGIVLVVGLALVSIALAIVLFIVVNNARKGSKNKDKKESANLSFEVEKNHNQQFGHHRMI